MDDENDELKARIDLLSPAVQDQARRIARKYGLSEEFNLSLSATMSNGYDGSIHAGTPPSILVNASFVMACLGDSKAGVRRLAMLLLRLVEMSPRFNRMLSLAPKSFFAGLPHEGKKFIKKPRSLFVVDESKVAITYSVTVTRIDTGESVSYDYLNGWDYAEIARYAIAKLGSITDITKEIVEEEKVLPPPKEDPNNMRYGSASLRSIDANTVKVEYDKET